MIGDDLEINTFQQYPHDVYLDFSKALVAAVKSWAVLGAGWLPSLAKRKGSNLLQ